MSSPGICQLNTRSHLEPRFVALQQPEYSGEGGAAGAQQELSAPQLAALHRLRAQLGRDEGDDGAQHGALVGGYDFQQVASCREETCS